MKSKATVISSVVNGIRTPAPVPERERLQQNLPLKYTVSHIVLSGPPEDNSEVGIPQRKQPESIQVKQESKSSK